MMAYLPSRPSVTIDTAKLSGKSILGWWFDPRSDDVTLIGDWILVLDDASLDYPPPGELGMTT